MPHTASGQGGTATWVPGMSMPPLGYGVVPQQPGGTMMMMIPTAQVGGQTVQSLPPQATRVAWQQQQQFAAAQVRR